MLGCNLHLKPCDSLRFRTFASLRLYSALKSRNPHNQGIVDLLQKYKDEENSKPAPNGFKVHAFNSAIWTVVKIERPIRSGKDVLTLPGIGPGITGRINDHLYKLYEEEAVQDRESYQEVVTLRATALFNKIPGIGPVKTKTLVDAGCISLEHLMSSKFSSMLSSKQLIQVKYLRHLEQPVLRRDAEEVLAFCREILDPRCETTLVGDYRRGLNHLSDIRIMISHPDFVHIPIPTDRPFGAPPPPKRTAPKEPKHRKRRGDGDIRTNILHSDFVPLLKRHGLISDTLASNPTSWQGIVRLPGGSGERGSLQDRMLAIEKLEGQFRKLNVHLVPRKSIGSALMSLTGDTEFEKDLSFAAQQNGMLFNEYGIWKWNPIQKVSSLSISSTDDLRPSEAETTAEGEEAEVEVADLEPANEGYWTLMKSASEEDIFQALEMDFVDPTRRNFAMLFGRPGKRRRTPVE